MNSRAPKTMLQPLTIEVGDATSGRYKSIDRITWRDIPPFAVLTGLNGAGKTQLLQVLAYKLAQAQHQQYPNLNAIPLSVTGDTIGPHELAYLPSAENVFRLGSFNISNLDQAKQQFLAPLTLGNTTNNIEAHLLSQRVARQLGIPNLHQVRPEHIAKLSDDFLYMLEFGDVSTGLSHVFVGY
jgi:hypothetical protein